MKKIIVTSLLYGVLCWVLFVVVFPIMQKRFVFTRDTIVLTCIYIILLAGITIFRVIKYKKERK